MGSLDRGFENALELQPAEVIRWRAPATYRIRRSWVGGRIYLSDRRLFFCPGVLSRGRYGVLRLPLSEVARVEVAARKFALGSVAEGGLRRRLIVTSVAGEDRAFSMQAFEKRVGELQALLAADASDRER
jgi:hypothetical protein